MNDKIKIRFADWQHLPDQTALRMIRTAVFINEQHVPPALEWDQEDNSALHLLICDDNGNGIACARLVMSSDLNHPTISSGKIGRMAVLAEWRRQGLGQVLLSFAIATLKQQQVNKITLSAQVHAIDFYQKAGFCVCSEHYLDAGILHVDMQLGHSKA